MACQEERAEIAVTLVENGASLNIQNKVRDYLCTGIETCTVTTCRVIMRCVGSGIRRVKSQPQDQGSQAIGLGSAVF